LTVETTLPTTLPMYTLSPLDRDSVNLRVPLVVAGGVAEYFPGVLKALGEMTATTPSAIPEPIMAGALGAALKARQRMTSRPG